MAGIRLQKVLADAGVASRRKCEELIAAGCVAVDGEVITRMGTKVDPEKQKVTVNGRPVGRMQKVYYLVNKPGGVICTNAPGSKRRRAIDLVPNAPAGVYTVGRLDVASEGLLIITNDGELANRIAHPRYGVRKVYEVVAEGDFNEKKLARLRKGIKSEVGLLRFERVNVKKRSRRSVVFEIELGEGKNREIRRAMAAVGLDVKRLRRLRIGKIALGRLKPGEARPVNSKERAYFQSLLKM
ncbi:MAG: rRNA pseudouridine synthase [Planctomycetota bacterium]|nr:MAG: rRNA pseudouridine synthase [Planctomycetota bacterium]